MGGCGEGDGVEGGGERDKGGRGGLPPPRHSCLCRGRWGLGQRGPPTLARWRLGVMGCHSPGRAHLQALSGCRGRVIR